MSNRYPGCLLLLAGAAVCILAGFAVGLRFSAGRLAGLGGVSLAQETPGAPTPPLFSPTPVPTPVPAPADTPLPAHLVIPPGQHNVARLYNGLQVRSSFQAEAGRLASVERETAASYALDLQLAIKVPVPSRTATELAASAPLLAGLLPKLPALLESAAVSKFYYGIYQNKTDVLRQNLQRLDALLPRDTFYDTETILELEDPQSKRRALLLQTDMNVDADGSDPDRTLEIDVSDPTFAPLTSYRWPRRTAAPNPLLQVYQDRLSRLLAEAKTAVAQAEHRRHRRAQERALPDGTLQLVDRARGSVHRPARVHGAAGGASVRAASRGPGGRHCARAALPRDFWRHRAERPARRGEPADRAGGRSTRDAGA